MVDLRLITILPPQPVQGVTQPQITGSSAQQTGLASFQAGSILSGFIINRDTNGNPILRTDSGDITFASNFFLKIGSEITIRIEHIAGNNSAHILSVNGQPPEVAAQQSSFAQEPEVIVSDNLRPNAGSNVSISEEHNPLATIIKGTVISPPQSNAQTASPIQTQTPLPANSQLSLKIVSIATPQITTAPPTPATQPIEPRAVKPENITIPNQPSTPQPTTNTNSSTLSPIPYSAYARIAATTPVPENIATPNPAIQTTTTVPPQQTQPSQTALPTQPLAQAPQPPQTGQQITATIISNQPSGEAILQTPVGMLRVQTPTPLPLGSHIVFEITEIQTPEMLENIASNLVIAAPSIATPAPLTELARSAGALSNIFTLLSGLGSSDALNFVGKNIPTIGSHIAGANNPNEQPAHNIFAPLLAFTSAIKTGDFRAWLGRGNSKWLENNGHENLLKKAEGEFLSIAKQFAEPVAHQWQSLFFPIAVNGELQQLRLFVKRDRKQNENDGKRENEEDTRFVLEMDLSQLGEMQMDGFVRRNSSNTENIQFDLIIRSHNELTQATQKDILNIYNDMGEMTGYKGSIMFQTLKDFPVNPMEEVVANKHEGVVV